MSHRKLSKVRRMLRGIPPLTAGARWLRSRLHPHHRALARIGREMPGKLLQPSGATFPDRYPAIFAFLAQHLASHPAPRILSYGCSTGEELLALNAWLPHARIVGVDINPYSLRLARRRIAACAAAPIGLRLCADPAELAGESFDAVLCLAVLRHGDLQAKMPERCDHLLPFARAEAFMGALAALVRPGGWLALWHVHFRFIDMAPARNFAVALRLPQGSRANRPLYGSDNCRRRGTACDEAVFRRHDAAA